MHSNNVITSLLETNLFYLLIFFQESGLTCHFHLLLLLACIFDIKCEEKETKAIGNTICLLFVFLIIQ